MKKLLIFFTLISIIYANEIGKLSLVKGDVNIQRQQNIIKAKSGDVIYNKDIINTSNTSKAQIRFKDGTIVTLGKNTNFSVNNYIYEQDNKDVNMSVDNGSFKVITGSIGKLARDNFKFKANSATIGIRGTIFAGNVSKTNNIIACVEGAIVVSTKNEAKQIVAGKMVEVVNNKLGDIKPLQTKDIETISSLDSKKLNEDTKLSSNEDNKSNNSSLNLATNDTTNQTKQTNIVSSNQTQNSSSSNQTVVAKVTEQSLEDIGTKVEKAEKDKSKQENEKPKKPTVVIPDTNIPDTKPTLPDITTPDTNIPNVNDKNNSVFYYSGKYELEGERVDGIGGSRKIKVEDSNAKAKVDYTKGSGAQLTIKQNAYGGVKNDFNFNHIYKEKDGEIDLRTNANDKLKLENNYNKMEFESVTHSDGNKKYEIEMKGNATSKTDFDSKVVY